VSGKPREKADLAVCPPGRATSIAAVERLDPSLPQANTEMDGNASTENEGADIGNTDQYTPAFESEEDAAAEVGYYYRDLCTMLRGQTAAIDSVTFWGVGNARSRLRTRPHARLWEQPLPFDDDLQAAPAYWGVVDRRSCPAARRTSCRPASPTCPTSR
jgi:endo-1,4-beta-xylanase